MRPWIPLVALLITGCGTLPGGGRWGENAYGSGFSRLGRAARDALLDPETLVPLAGAAIFTIDDFDERTSAYATSHHPVYGSDQGADDASDILLGGLLGEAIVTSLVTPSGPEADRWILSKAKGLGLVELPAAFAAAGVTQVLKGAVGRTRPNGVSDTSFPSGHATAGATGATLSNRHLASIPMPGGARTALQTLNFVGQGALSWARVEAGSHYPSDALVGAAIGHFVTATLYDAFLGLPESAVHLDVSVSPAGWLVGLSWSPRAAR